MGVKEKKFQHIVLHIDYKIFLGDNYESGGIFRFKMILNKITYVSINDDESIGTYVVQYVSKFSYKENSPSR